RLREKNSRGAVISQRDPKPVQCARSSFRRMFTKVYGGHGPVYLNVSVSYCWPISLTRESNACSISRDTRNAAFMIILSPIGLLDREATDTSRGAPKIPA